MHPSFGFAEQATQNATRNRERVTADRSFARMGFARFQINQSACICSARRASLPALPPACGPNSSVAQKLRPQTANLNKMLFGQFHRPAMESAKAWGKCPRCRCYHCKNQFQDYRSDFRSNLADNGRDATKPNEGALFGPVASLHSLPK